MADLVDKIREAGPAAIALDILMPEADALSPERLLARGESGDTALRRPCPAGKPTIRCWRAPSPPPTRCSSSPEPRKRRAWRCGRRRSPCTTSAGREPPMPPWRRTSRITPGALTSIDVLDRAAAARGLISVDTEGGVVRRVPLAASIDGTLVPALAIEMIRTVLHEPSVHLHVTGSRVEGISVGDFAVPTEADGAVRIYYSRRGAQRFVSAVDVIEGKVDRSRLAQKLVLIGVTGLGLLEYQNTPVGERMPGSEIHAQLLENLYDGTLLRRPGWAPWLETAVFLLLGSWLVVATPRWKPRNAALLLVIGIVLPALVAFAAFRAQRTLFDAATPAVGLMLLFGVLLVLTLTEATRQKKALERVVQVQREEAARVAGELQAARRIQTATLPHADLLAGDARIEIAATMIPARETGGDLYDYFRLDDGRLFFLVGDVAGKGLSASIFMAVSKALYKERDAACAGRRYRPHHVGRQRRSLARQPGNAVRHRVRRNPRPRHRRASVLQRRAREPVPDRSGRDDRPSHRGWRRSAALRTGRLRSIAARRSRCDRGSFSVR
jgi:CHASE2 domain-containing sensor protein